MKSKELPRDFLKEDLLKELEDTWKSWIFYSSTSEQDRTIKRLNLTTNMPVIIRPSLPEKEFPDMPKILISVFGLKESIFECKIEEETNEEISISLKTSLQEYSIITPVVELYLSVSANLESLEINSSEKITMDYQNFIKILSFVSGGDIKVRNSFQKGVFKALYGKISIKNDLADDNSITAFTLTKNIHISVSTKKVICIPNKTSKQIHKKLNNTPGNRGTSTITPMSRSGETFIKN
jgi:hypothetical protein